MEELFRSLVGRLNESVKGYFKPSRKGITLPLTVEIQPKFETTSRVEGRLAEGFERKKRKLAVAGESRDISEEGISFIVPFIRLGEHYLVDGGETTLNIVVDLPGGQIRLKALGCRYQQIGLDAATASFLVGARIVSMGTRDRIMLEEYLLMAKGRRGNVEGVQWGLDLRN